jgi:hypothetical protein
MNNIRHKITTANELLTGIVRQRPLTLRLLGRIPLILRSYTYSKTARFWPDREKLTTTETSLPSARTLEKYFNSHHEGRGIWKCTHYFDIYESYFQKFVGREVHVLEVGIYSGGSLDMWRHYFGDKCRVYGVDIQEECLAYKDVSTQILIGDQSDRSFWRRVKEQIPPIDILIDDGGHQPEQQIVTLEEMLPHIRPGGVYLCEDICGELNPFASYIHGLASNLNCADGMSTDPQKGISCSVTPFQSHIQSIHIYPFVTVVQRNDHPMHQITAPKHGTQWQPFL